MVMGSAYLIIRPSSSTFPQDDGGVDSPQFFGALTLKSEWMSQRKRHNLRFAFFRASFHKVPFGKLHWVLREEKGESFGRIHFYYLFAGVPRSRGGKAALSGYSMRAWIWLDITA
jgi:hypothetical protein